jgi:ATP-binding cassette subfamily B protein
LLVKEEIPESLLNQALQHLNGDGDVKIAVSFDLDPAGKLSSGWLLATGQRVLIFHNDSNEPELLHDYKLVDLKEIACDGQVGNGFLTAILDGQQITLARYSNAHARKFGAAAQQLSALSKGEDAKPDPDALPKKCPKCNFPLEAESTVCANCVNKRRVLTRLLDYAKPYRATGALVLFLLISAVGLGLVPPYLTKILVDRVLPGNNVWLLSMLVLGLFGAALVSAGLSVIQGRVGAWMGARITHSIRMQLCEHIEKLSVSYFDKRQIGSVMARVQQDTGELQRFLTDDIYYFIAQLVQLVGGLTLILFINWKLGLIALIPAPLTAFLTSKVIDNLRRGPATSPALKLFTRTPPPTSACSVSSKGQSSRT